MMRRLILLAVLGGALCAQSKTVSTLDFSALALQADEARRSGDRDRAVGLYNKALSVRPNWAEGLFALGLLYSEQARFANCVAMLQRVATLQPNTPVIEGSLGICEFRTGNFTGAFPRLRKARALGLPITDPKGQEVAYYEALLHTRAANYELAMRLLVDVARQGTDSPELVIATGITALRQPILPVALKPEDRELCIMLGRAVIIAGRRKPLEADELFAEIVQQYPRSVSAHYTYATFLLGVNADRAMQEFGKVLELDPQHVPSLVTRGMEYVRRSDFDSARKDTAAAVKYGPQAFAAHAAHGRVLLELDEIPGAILHLETAVKMAPDSPQVRYSLSQAYTKAGRKADAAREREVFAKLKRAMGSTELAN